MAIARDSTSVGPAWSTGDPQTFSHTCSGSDRYLLVYAYTGGSSQDEISGVTYNGVSMTRENLGYDVNGNAHYIYGLVNPATGSNTVSIDLTSNQNLSAIAISYTGVDQTNPIDSFVFDQGAGGPVGSFTSSNVTPSNANSWLIGTVRSLLGVPNCNELVEQVKVEVAIRLLIYDSDGTVATSSQNVTYPDSSNGSTVRMHGHHLLVLNEATGGGGGYRFVPQLNPFAGL